MFFKKIAILAVAIFSANGFSETPCSKEQAKESVLKMCKSIEEKGEGAKSDIQKYRYCGDNYVWVQNAKDITMVIHPIKVALNGKDLKEHKDEKGKFLFIEFDKAAKANSEGGWVDYVWAKAGAEKATDKESFVKLCKKGDLEWIAGSGVWK